MGSGREELAPGSLTVCLDPKRVSTRRHAKRAFRVPWLLALGLAVGGGLSSCQKKPPPPNTAPENAAAQSDSAAETATAAPETPAPAAVPESRPAAPAASVQSVDGVVVPFLTSQLRIFIQEKGRLPESFAEFAGARLDSVPRLAPGLAFAIDPATQEVKVVRK